jgi:hypothetical protein
MFHSPNSRHAARTVMLQVRADESEEKKTQLQQFSTPYRRVLPGWLTSAGENPTSLALADPECQNLRAGGLGM